MPSQNQHDFVSGLNGVMKNGGKPREVAWSQYTYIELKTLGDRPETHLIFLFKLQSYEGG